MPPFPGMPYGQAPAWSFPIFECSIYLLFFACFLHAYKRGVQSVSYLIGGAVFGLLLEYMQVLLHYYTYGHFWIMLGRPPLDIPLCIGVAWGAIMYSVRLFSDWVGLPWWSAAALDTVLALNLDMSMDIVAYRMHMWHWYWNPGYNPLRSQWFGVPWGNFVGWQTVVFCYSGFSRLVALGMLRTKGGIFRSLGVTIAAVLASLGVLYGTERIFPYMERHWHIYYIHRFILVSLFLGVLIVLGWRKRKAPAGDLARLTLILPGWFHFFSFLCFIVLGFYLENKWMTAAAILNLAAGIALHYLPIEWSRKPSGQGKGPRAGALYGRS